MMAPWVRNVQR